MIIIDVETRSKKWQNQERKVQNICKKLIPLTEIAKIKSDIELSISLVSDLQIKKINHEFRNKNQATNVLSFPSLDENLVRKLGLVKVTKGLPHVFLGDIVISFDSLKKESLAQKKNFDNHLTHLILHSLLHLIGFDHEDDKMAKKMENLEIKILKKLNINNPYILDGRLAKQV